MRQTLGFALLAGLILLQSCVTYPPVTSIRMNGFTTINTNAFGVVYLEECVADPAGNPMFVQYVVDRR